MSYDVDTFDIPTNDPDVIIEVSLSFLLLSVFKFKKKEVEILSEDFL